MKTFRFLFTSCLLLVATEMMQAQVNVLFVDPVVIEPEGTAEIVVRIDYDMSQYNSFQYVNGYTFCIALPDGIFPNTKSGNWTGGCVTLSDETHPYFYDDETEEYTKSPKSALTVKITEEGDARLIWVDPDMKHRLSLVSTHGELMRISVRASADFVSGAGKLYEIMLVNDSSAFDLHNIADVPIYFNEDITPVTSVVNDMSADVTLYNLQGIRTSGVKKGLYISNGKKYVR